MQDVANMSFDREHRTWGDIAVIRAAKGSVVAVLAKVAHAPKDSPTAAAIAA